MANTGPIRISFQYTQDDFLQAWRFYRSTLWMVKSGKPIAVLPALFGVWLLTVIGFQWYIPLMFLFALEEWFDIIGELRCWFYYRANQNAYSERYDLTIDESGIYVKSPTVEARRSWQGYIGFMESERVFLLFQGKRLFAVYPKRAFQDEDQLRRFRKWASEGIRVTS